MQLKLETHSFNISSKGNCDIIDITGYIQQIVSDNLFLEGSALVFVPGSTAGITTIEYEPCLL